MTGAAAREGGKRVCWGPVLRVTVSSEPPQGRNAARIRVRCRVRGGSSYMLLDSGRLQDPHLPCGSSHIVWFCISMRSVVSLYPPNGVAPVAQWIEHLITVQEGWGSSPFGRRSRPPRCDPPVGVLHFRKHSCGSAFSISADHCGDSHDRWDSALRRVTRLAVSRPTARSVAHAAPQSPVHLRYRRRNAPRVLPGKTQ